MYGISVLNVDINFQMDLHYNKHGPNDEIEKCNKTGLPGLEGTLPNSYCNSMLQVILYLYILYNVYK